MDPENIMLSEISQSERGTYYVISLICGINEKTELTSEIQTDSESRMTAMGSI